MPDDCSNPGSPYTRSYLISVIVHVTMLLVLAVVGAINGCQCIRRQKKLSPAPLEFTVAIPEEFVPSESEAKDEDKTPDPPDEPETIREPEPEKPKKIEKPKAKPTSKPKFVKSNKIIEKKPKGKPKEVIKNLPKDFKPVKVTGAKLTAAEIQRLLDLGAKPSDHTVVPGDDGISLLSIKNALYKAWIVPSAEHLTGRPVEIEITLGASGAVLGYRVVASSGSRVLDNSALAAAAAVRQIPDLTPNFLRSHRKVTIAFDLE